MKTVTVTATAAASASTGVLAANPNAAKGTGKTGAKTGTTGAKTGTTGAKTGTTGAKTGAKGGAKGGNNGTSWLVLYCGAGVHTRYFFSWPGQRRVDHRCGWQRFD